MTGVVKGSHFLANWPCPFFSMNSEQLSMNNGRIARNQETIAYHGIVNCFCIYGAEVRFCFSYVQYGPTFFEKLLTHKMIVFIINHKVILIKVLIDV
jgi:hypothetical protein